MEKPDTPQSNPPQDTQEKPSAQAFAVEMHDIHSNRDIAAFSYVWAMSLVAILLRGKSPYVRFHALQGIGIFAISIFGFVLGMWFPILNKIIQTAVFFLSVCGFAIAYSEKKAEIPLLGSIVHGTFTFKGLKKRLKEDASILKSVSKEVLNNQERSDLLQAKLQYKIENDIQQAYYDGLESSVSDFDEIELQVTKEMENDPDLKREIAYEKVMRRRADEKLGKDRYIRYANNISVDKRSKERLNDVTDVKYVDDQGRTHGKVPWKE